MKLELPTSDTCALCEVTTDLVKSHIIPKFFFRKIKSDGPTYRLFSPALDIPPKKRQDEMQELLFCNRCDNVTLRENETYLANVLFEKFQPHNFLGTGSINLEGLDYGRIQRALLSILWRMSLSNHDYFKLILLDEIHSAKIKYCILNADAFPQRDYPIMCTIPLIKGKSYSDWMLTPHFLKINGNTIYHCLMAGFLFSFIVGPRLLCNDVQKLILKESGTWTISRLELDTMPILFEWFNDAVNYT